MYKKNNDQKLYEDFFFFFLHKFDSFCFQKLTEAYIFYYIFFIILRGFSL